MSKSKEIVLLENQVCTFGRYGGGPTVGLPVQVPRRPSGSRQPGVGQDVACQLINAACRVTIQTDPLAQGDAKGQETLADFGDDMLATDEVLAKVSTVTGSTKLWSFTLSFDSEVLSESGCAMLDRHFSNRSGVLTLAKLGDAPEQRGRPKKEVDDDGGNESENG